MAEICTSFKAVLEANINVGLLKLRSAEQTQAAIFTQWSPLISSPCLEKSSLRWTYLVPWLYTKRGRFSMSDMTRQFYTWPTTQYYITTRLGPSHTTLSLLAHWVIGPTQGLHCCRFSLRHWSLVLSDIPLATTQILPKSLFLQAKSVSTLLFMHSVWTVRMS